MPISNTDLQELAKVSLDEYLRNLPVDQIAVERPFLKKLMDGRKSLLGAKQNVVENIRKEHGSNFSWAFGEETVKFNKRNTIETFIYKEKRHPSGWRWSAVYYLVVESAGIEPASANTLQQVLHT